MDWKKQKPQGEPRGFWVEGWLELDTRGELRGAARIGLSAGDLAKTGVSEHWACDGELGVVGDVVQIALEVQPGSFPEVKGEAATKADVQIVVARTVDVIRGSTWQIAEGVGRRVHERI